ncbi:MAG: alpha/beta hydrolase [Chloroflexota bacterium]|nr:alpha/beta hydrolase [Chloroflexota bacterium]
MVPGANGSADAFKAVAEHLAAQYTVVTYDRRGFSHSQLNGPQDYEHRLKTDADDVWRLHEHFSHEPSTVFGSSSGAIVALELLTRHPSVVETLVPFEPPAVRQLADGQKWLDFFASLYELYRQSGPQMALHKFRQQAFAESDRLAMARTMDHNDRARMVANATYWFEHELRQYPAVDLDLEVLKAHANRIVVAVGRESRGYPAYEVNVELAKKLAEDMIELPGGHLGFVSQPAEFARELVEHLRGGSVV